MDDSDSKFFNTNCGLVFNNLGLKMYSLWGSRVPLNIPHLKNFAATINFYTHHINVSGIFPCHIHISDLCHFLGQANSKTSNFMKLGSQTGSSVQKWCQSSSRISAGTAN